MSTTVTAKVKLQQLNMEALRRAAQQAQATVEENATVRFFDGRKVKGTAIQLPGWRYPVVITPDGEVLYDNYSGHWGKQETLDGFLQKYTAENVADQAMAAGWVPSIYTQEDGSVVVELTSYGS